MDCFRISRRRPRKGWIARHRKSSRSLRSPCRNSGSLSPEKWRIACWRLCAKKSYKPGAATACRLGGGGRPAVLRACGVPVFEGVEIDVLVSAQRANERGAEAAQADEGAQREARPLRVSANRRLAAAGGLAGRKETRAAVAKMPRAASAAHQGQGGASWPLHGGCRRRPSTGVMFGAGTSSRMPPRVAAPYTDDSGRIHP